MEVVTEAKVLKHPLSQEELESAARLFSKGKQWERAIYMLAAVESPSESTSFIMFESLAIGGQGKQAKELLHKMEGQNPTAGFMVEVSRLNSTSSVQQVSEGET